MGRADGGSESGTSEPRVDGARADGGSELGTSEPRVQMGNCSLVPKGRNLVLNG